MSLVGKEQREIELPWLRSIERVHLLIEAVVYGAKRLYIYHPSVGKRKCYPFFQRQLLRLKDLSCLEDVSVEDPICSMTMHLDDVVPKGLLRKELW